MRMKDGGGGRKGWDGADRRKEGKGTEERRWKEWRGDSRVAEKQELVPSTLPHPDPVPCAALQGNLLETEGPPP
jgi:hypothetical protein